MGYAIPPTSAAIRAHVADLLQQQLGDVEIDLDADFTKGLGLDWVSRIDLIESLEAAYQVEIADDDLCRAATGAAVADLVIHALGLDPDYEEEA